jgi:hypothetical protein
MERADAAGRDAIAEIGRRPFVDLVPIHGDRGRQHFTAHSVIVLSRLDLNADQAPDGYARAIPWSRSCTGGRQAWVATNPAPI